MEHAVDGRVFGGNRGQARRAAIVLVHEVEGATNAGQHAERQYVDLQDTEGIEIVLVPLDGGAVLHGRVHDRTDFVEPVAGDNKPSDMLGQVPGKTRDLLGHRHHLRHGAFGRIEPHAADVGFAHAAVRPAPDGAGQCADRVFRQTEGLADLAHRRARAVGDDGRGKPGALAAVLFVNVLHHLFAPLVLEVDVDIGGFVAFRRDEAFEQKVGSLRIDLGDAEHETDGGIGGRAAPLGQDAALAGETDDVVDGEKIGRVAEFGDELQFMVEGGPDLGRNPGGIALARAFFGQDFQSLLRGGGAAGGLVGILITQLFQAEGQPFHHGFRFADRLRPVAEDSGHLGRLLEVAFAIGGQQPAGGRQGRVFADAGDDVLHLPPFRPVIERFVGGQKRCAEAPRGSLEQRQTAVIPRSVGHAGHQPDRARKSLRQASQGRAQTVVGPRGRAYAEHQAGTPGEEILQVEMARAFLGPPITEGEQPAKPAVGGTVGRPGEDVRCSVTKHQTASDRIGEAGFPGRQMAAHDSGQGVAVAHRDAGKAQPRGLEGQFLRVRGAAQEREIRGDGQFGETGHANTPCRNQRGAEVSRPYRPSR